MAEKKIQSTGQSFRLIPKYRDEIDVRKICQMLIMTAKDMPKAADKNEPKGAGEPQS
ncbi:hypothetical protein [Hornefia butyriciproducens]|uniref:hypothetical protein n=1 Tax=Hornefia butyriciproducens TaxID=2652293 RepID=UPI002A90A952|nr:hypothetical protein [Hornefia butyriciproducens]MDY6212367.1 hypothetical protein [Hornefia butyriciproducens]